MLNTGLSEVIGSWKIIEMRLPRMRRIASSSRPSRSRRSRRMLPLAMVPGGLGTSRITASEVTDLPHPDSPTMPSVSRRPTARSTPSTARTV